MSSMLVLSVVALFAHTVAATGRCAKACKALEAQIPSSNTTSAPQPDLYWAQQAAEVIPECYIGPKSAEQVSLIVKTAQKYQCPFAIRGGGHSDVPFASNSQGGITLNLEGLQAIKVSPDRTSTQLGAGLAWGDIYQALDAQNLTVVGGRESTVGMAGLTLGGGVSYFSGLHGLACDNVRNFQVVLADGRIVDVNGTSQNADLYRALRGGGNNFGVVTRFDLDTYQQGALRGGLISWTDSNETADELLSGFAKFAEEGPTDPKASAFISIGYSNGTYVWSGGLTYTAPVTQNPPIYAPFYTAHLNSSQTFSTERITTHGALASELGTTQPSGRRQQFHTATYKTDVNLLKQIVQIWREEVERVFATPPKNATGIAPNLAFQPLSTNILQQMSKRGGNVLGLYPYEAPLTLLSMSWPWDAPEDDDLIVGAMDNVVSRSNAVAKGMGLLNDYIYMNYAPPNLPVVASYGPENVAFMKQVAKRYDPSGVFQKLVPGGFKLPQ